MVFLSCAAGPHVRTYELTSDALRAHRTLGSLNAEVTCARYNHNGKILASCSVDGGIALDVAASGELLSRFFYPTKNLVDRRVNAVQFSSGSRFLVSGGSDGCARVWDLKTQEVTQSYTISASPVTSVVFSGYKDDFLVAGSESGAITVCDVQSTEAVGFLSVDPSLPVASVTSILASPHPYARQMLGSTYADGSVRVWDIQTGQLTAEFAHVHEAAATSLVLSPVSKVLLASGGLDRRVLFFDTQQRQELRSIDFDHPVTSLALCADGKTLAVGTTAGEIMIYDLRGVITPLYSVTPPESSPISSLHFAAPIADASSAFSSAAVFPQGQPIISTDRVVAGPLSPSKADATREMIASKSLAPDPTDVPQVSLSSTPSTTPASNFLSPAASGAQPPPSDSQPTKSLLRPTSFVISTQVLPQKAPVSEVDGCSSPKSFRPSLFSMLADSSTYDHISGSEETDLPSRKNMQVPLPLTSPTNYSISRPESTDSIPVAGSRVLPRARLREELHGFQQELLGLRQEHDSRFEALVQSILAQYDAVVNENDRLRRENDRLRSLVGYGNGPSGVQ